MTDQITKAQIAKIWACAHSLGLDEELLYLLVPRGSISAMTKHEASELIEHLTQLAGQRIGPAHQESRKSQRAKPAKQDPNAVTPEQRNFIYFLFGRIGWLHDPARIRGFLKKFAHADSVEELPDRKRASAIIEALKAIYKRQRRAEKEAAVA